MKRLMYFIFTFLCLQNTDAQPIFQSVLSEPISTGTPGRFVDYNGDGADDYIIRSGATGILSLYDNNNSGYQFHQTINGHPHALPNSMGFSGQTLSSDFDNDGNMDLLMYSARYWNCSNNSVRIYWGTGGSTLFSSSNFLGLAINAPFCVAAYSVDFDNDGDLDVFIRSASGLNTMHRNDGNRNFTQVPTLNTGRDIHVQFHDYNGDGFPDLAYTKDGWADGQWGFRFNAGLGNGNFSSATSVQYAALQPDNEMFLSSSNPLQNSSKDVIFTCQADGTNRGTLYVGEWNGTGFTFNTQTLPFSSGIVLDILDYNNDGFEDVLYRYTSNSTAPYGFELVALLNDGYGNYSSVEVVLSNSRHNPTLAHKEANDLFLATRTYLNTGAHDSTFVLKTSVKQYILQDTAINCNSGSYCMPIIPTDSMDGVKGFEFSIAYDTANYTPSGNISINPNALNGNVTDVEFASNAALNSGTLVGVVYFKSSAPLFTEFEGIESPFCVEFIPLNNTGVGTFTLNNVRESYDVGIQDFSGNDADVEVFKDTLSENKVIYAYGGNIPFYDSTQTTIVEGVSSSCSPTGYTSPIDANGYFTLDIVNNHGVKLSRDINNATMVMPIINGNDASILLQILLEDPNYTPNALDFITADVNMDNVVSAGDLTQLNQRTVLIRGEFTQASMPSKDWVFLDSSLLSTPNYTLSSSYPNDDGTGISRHRVPILPDCFPLDVVNANTCPIVGTSTYLAILLGDLDGNQATNTPFLKAGAPTLALDLDRSIIDEVTCEIAIPVISDTTNDVHAIDFIMKHSQDITFSGHVSAAPSTLSSVHNYDNVNLLLTSYDVNSFPDTAYYLVFELHDTMISPADFTFLEGYVNGELANMQVSGGPVAVECFTTGTSPLVSNELQWSVFPNPFENEITIQFDLDKGDDIRFSLIDVLGREVYDMGEQYYPAGNHTLNMELDLPKGMYLIRMQHGDKLVTKKLISQ